MFTRGPLQRTVVPLSARQPIVRYNSYVLRPPNSDGLVAVDPSDPKTWRRPLIFT